MNAYTKPVYYTETDIEGNIKVEAIIDEISNIINYHSETIGKGVKFLLDVGRTWFVIGWHIEILDYPKLLDEITMKTWGYDRTSSLCSRNVIMKRNEQMLVRVDSLWAVYSIDAGRLVKIEDIDFDGYDVAEPLDMVRVDRKMKADTGELVSEITFARADMDYNRHVTNTAYIKHAIGLIPEGEKIRDIKIIYNKQTKLSETLKVYMKISQNTRKCYDFLMAGEDMKDVRVNIKIETGE